MTEVIRELELNLTIDINDLILSEKRESSFRFPIFLLLGSCTLLFQVRLGRLFRQIIIGGVSPSGDPCVGR